LRVRFLRYSSPFCHPEAQPKDPGTAGDVSFAHGADFSFWGQMLRFAQHDRRGSPTKWSDTRLSVRPQNCLRQGGRAAILPFLQPWTKGRNGLKRSDFDQLVSQKVLIGDGAMGTMLYQ
jgi:hypothetical protein